MSTAGSGPGDGSDPAIASGPGNIEITVPGVLDGERIDRAVALLTGLSRSEVNRLIENHAAQVDGQVVVSRSRPLLAGQRLAVAVTAGSLTGPTPDHAVVFDVVHEDEHLIVVSKPPGLVVHHGAGQHGSTLVDGLLARYPELALLPLSGAGDPWRPGIVHRLDKGTSGLMAVARTTVAYHHLGQQLRSRTAGRVYTALVSGLLESASGIVDAPIGRSARRPTTMAVSHQGRPARTSYRVVARYEGPPAATLIEATLETGRTHQVRVHLAAIGHPVIGDDRYGGNRTPRGKPVVLEPGGMFRSTRPALAAGRLFLHAHQLTLDHPAGGRMTWFSPLPDDLERVLQPLRRP
jgi:23S rRNA pseudouridine1911/1915/1917 synthase